MGLEFLGFDVLIVVWYVAIFCGWGGFIWLVCTIEIVGEPAPRAIDSLLGLRTIAHSPVSIELYRLRLFLDVLTAEGAEGAEEEMRGMDNSDVKGFDLSGGFNFIYSGGFW